MRIMVAGSGRLGVSVIEPLLASHHEVVGLIQNGRGKRNLMRTRALLRARVVPSNEDPVRLAIRHGLPVLWLDKMTQEGLSSIRVLKPDLIISCGFGIIFKRALIDIPTVGCMNVHSSLLPKHRGPAPFAHVILDNEAESGVTFHVIDENIDTGDILCQTAFPLTPIDTAMTVYRKACTVAKDRILEVVSGVEREGLHGTSQDSSRATYDAKLTREKARICWDREAADLDRLVRGSIPYVDPWFTYRGRAVRVALAEVDLSFPKAPVGAVLQTRPRVIVATARDSLALNVAYCNFPFPWTWPMPGNRPRLGEILD